MGRRLRTILTACVSGVAAVYVASAGCGHGVCGYFSPDTLDCRTHAEWLIPLTRVRVFRGPISTHRYPAVDWLVAQGYWSKSDVPDPRWLPTFRWNEQWKDGQSYFHEGLRGDAWVRWSKHNPEMARALWPKVLTALRRPGVTSTTDAGDLMMSAQVARSQEEFEEMAGKLVARPRGLTETELGD